MSFYPTEYTLHGDLDLLIREAKDLPNMDLVVANFRRCFDFCSSTFACRNRSSDPAAPPDDPGRGHHHNHNIITSDPYVTVVLAGATVARTRVIKNTEYPHWNETFSVPVAHTVSSIKFFVKDNDVFGADVIGTVVIAASRFANGEVVDGWFDLIGPDGKRPKWEPKLWVSVKYTPVELNPLYRRGIPGDPDQLGVRGTYFPLRKGGTVTLYQDAHVNHGDLPEIELEGGEVFTHERCWEDICHAILEAKDFVYIIGWSIYHKVRLVREPTRPLPRGGELSLGDLLKIKADAGVKVCLLVWDDRTSSDNFLVKTGGVMETHDEDTRKFFRHTPVNCLLSPRYGSRMLSIFRKQVVESFYTHHQKCVLVDTEASQSDRKITSFIGGLDLCNGRYDTPEHRLFKDIGTVFNDDFHNPTFAKSIETEGPRQPWHDLHCKIEGPAAYDILKNFEQRWQRAAKWWDYGGWHDLSPTMTYSDPTIPVSKESDDRSWNVQVFRSIDSGSVRGFSVGALEARQMNLVCGKNLVIDISIHTAYVNAIRCAQHFIYIENQYFIGSSYGWPSHQHRNAGADNLIPMELALKVASKIRAKERFAVYIIIPMWPEGVPTDAATQEILFWQAETMQMMYKIIANELKEGSHPLDYLNFYCLGNRELQSDGMLHSNGQSTGKSASNSSQEFRRFMVYVHSKGMIVDDEYILLGSANINQRSLDGSRDTEIAMGTYQPHHTWAAKKGHLPPRGQIHGFRMSLWAEHLGKVSTEVSRLFEEPDGLACVKCVNRIAEENWDRYTVNANVLLQGHLLKYPVEVDRYGTVWSKPGKERFPDVGGKILGTPSNLPDALTT